MFTRPRLGLVALLCAVAFAAGALFARPLSAGRFDPYRKLGVFSKVLSYIENIYVENVSEADLMYGAARGLTDVLDPHSRFMDPTEYANLKREIEGESEIEGIGIDIEKTKKRLVIVSPIEGSPAARAGIEPGDVIRKIDGTDADNIEWEDAIGRLKGPAGTEVVLVIERAGAQRTLRIKREKFEVKTVEGRVIEDSFGYVRLRLFASNSETKMVEAIDDILKRTKNKGGMRGLILDMRRNPGGQFDQGVRIADRFLESGLIVRTVGKGGKELDRQMAVPRGTYSGFPMVVLVDGASASAAEIVAGALQDQKRAVVMGTQTFGKGSVQTVMDLGDCDPTPCGLKLTVSRYYTPNGRSIQNQGITPDVLVGPLPPPVSAENDDIMRENSYKRRLNNEQGDVAKKSQRMGDHQLQTAVDYLKSFAVFQTQSGKKD